MVRTELGLVPGGGGVRGLARIGVLQAFTEEKIRVGCIAPAEAWGF
jgi:predicted acylesterase/phospholipase RssA